MLIGEIK